MTLTAHSAFRLQITGVHSLAASKAFPTQIQKQSLPSPAASESLAKQSVHSPAASESLLALPKSNQKARHRARSFDSHPANQNPLRFSSDRGCSDSASMHCFAIAAIHRRDPAGFSRPACDARHRERRRLSMNPSIHGLCSRNENVVGRLCARAKQFGQSRDFDLAIDLTLDLGSPLSALSIAGFVDKARRGAAMDRRTRDQCGDALLSDPAKPRSAGRAGVSRDALKRISRRRAPAHGCAGRPKHHGWLLATNPDVRAAHEAWRRGWILFGDFLLSTQEKVTRSTQASGSSAYGRTKMSIATLNPSCALKSKPNNVTTTQTKQKCGGSSCVG